MNTSITLLVILALFNGYLLAKAPLFGVLCLVFTIAYGQGLQTTNEIDYRKLSKILLSAVLVIILMVIVLTLFFLPLN